MANLQKLLDLLFSYFFNVPKMVLLKNNFHFLKIQKQLYGAKIYLLL